MICQYAHDTHSHEMCYRTTRECQGYYDCINAHFETKVKKNPQAHKFSL